MERDLDKTQQSGFMNDLLGHSEISENVNTLQKVCIILLNLLLRII